MNPRSPVEATDPWAHPGAGEPGLVSVILPAYNREHELARALDSVLAQEYRPIEVIVVDDGSADGTAGVATAYGPPVRLVRHASNAGVSAARNTGILSSRGEFIAFQDSDDEWLPGKLERQVALLRAHPEHVFASCDTEIRRVDEVVRVHAEMGACEGPEAWKMLLRRNFVPTPTVVVRRGPLFRTRGFDTALRVGEDLDLWIRLAAQGSIGLVRDVLLLVHQEQAGLMKSTSRGEDRIVLPMLRAHMERLSARLTPAERESILGQRQFEFGYRLRRSDPLAAIPLLWRAYQSGHRPVAALRHILQCAVRAVPAAVARIGANHG